MNDVGEHVISWDDNPSDSYKNNDIHVQSFSTDGTPIGSEFLANTTLAGWQSAHSVALNNRGQLLVTWVDHERSAVFAQAFDGDRMPIGNELQLSTYANQQDFAFNYTDVAMDDSGRYVAVWVSEGQDGDDGGVFARIGVIPEPATVLLALAGVLSLLIRDFPYDSAWNRSRDNLGLL